MLRTYLQGVEFHHIQEPGYLYRIHPGNTVKAREKQIHVRIKDARRENIVPLAREWCRREGYQTLNIGEAIRKDQWDPKSGVFSGLFALADSSVGLVLATAALEFIPPSDQVQFFNELYRVMAPGAILTGQVPNAQSGFAGIQDPRHLTSFNINSLKYYCESGFAKLNPKIACRFQAIQLYEKYETRFQQENGMRLIQFDLCALKGQRQPGKQLI